MISGVSVHPAGVKQQYFESPGHVIVSCDSLQSLCLGVLIGSSMVQEQRPCIPLKTTNDTITKHVEKY